LHERRLELTLLTAKKIITISVLPFFTAALLPDLSNRPCGGCTLLPMSESRNVNQADGRADTAEADEAPKRRAGAAPGNRNALKHGRYGAKALAARAAKRAQILSRIPDWDGGFPARRSIDFAAAMAPAAEGGPQAQTQTDKRNNSVAPATSARRSSRRSAAAALRPATAMP
jgi:hypothetical protein